MGEVYNGYSIMPGPNDPGWLVRYPAVEIDGTPGVVVKAASSIADAKVWIDLQISAAQESR